MAEIKANSIPASVIKVAEMLQEAGYQAYLVGGCVRDLLLGQAPKDWDLTTDARPDQIQAVFPDSFYENSFGTVGVVDRETEDPSLQVIEVTPYRIEGKYSDSRRPDEVIFSTNIEDDLKRRDFTINAIAYDPIKGQTIDLYKGQDDLYNKVLRAVGDAEARFSEDALRILRAVRFVSQLGFMCNHETLAAMQKTKDLLGKISKERIRDEFSKLLMSNDPMTGLAIAEKLGILDYIAPVLRETVGVEQNKQAHKYDVWEHLLRSLQHGANKGFSLEIRLAALFHDIAKPRTKREIKDRTGKVINCTFYGHEVVGARMTKQTLQDLKFPGETIQKVEKLVRWHMFFSATEEITLSAVRRLVVNVGEENIWDLMKLRACDRIGSGRPVENPYRLRKYKSMIEEALRAPLSVGMLKIKGTDVIRETGEPAGPKIGFTLHALFEEVLEDPSLNNEMFLVKRAKELVSLPLEDLKILGEAGKRRKESEDERIVEEIRKKHNVK